MARAKKNEEAEWEKNKHCVLSNNISKKKSLIQFIAAEMKLTSNQLSH